MRFGKCMAAVAVAGLAACSVAAGQTVTAPGDQIIPVQVSGGDPNVATIGGGAGGAFGTNNSPAAEQAANAIDQKLTTKYLNFAGTSTNLGAGDYPGFIVTPSSGATILSAIQFAAANDSPDRDPTQIAIYGTNDPISSTTAGDTINATFVPIYSGVSGLATDPGRNTLGAVVPIVPTTLGTFSSYEVLVTGVRGGTTETCCTQFAEVNLVGVPEPAALGVLAAGGVGLLVRRRRA